MNAKTRLWRSRTTSLALDHSSDRNACIAARTYPLTSDD
jgi:hypothetical protein